MSELMMVGARGNLRWRLLTTASALVLCAHFGTPGAARAASIDRPTVWIELGGQAERNDTGHPFLAPSFFDSTPGPDLAPMVDAQRPSRYSIGAEGKVTIAPHNTNWIVSAAVRFGRSDNARHLHQQTPVPPIYQVFGTQILGQPQGAPFGDGQSEFKQSHLVVDFQAGKDVGLGLFGTHATSVVSGGVRFAQFTSSSNIALNARPEFRFGDVHSGSRVLYQSSPVPHYITATYRSYDFFRRTGAASLLSKRSTHAIGPSLSWDASAPIGGNGDDMTLNLDWGLNVAVLFGRQRSQTSHQTTGHSYSKTGGRFKYHTTPDGDYVRGNIFRSTNYAHGPTKHTRSRMSAIPNVGGFAAISLKFFSARFSLGYRADMFFNASDAGIDTRREVNQNYFGPYATVSIGLGG